MKDKAIRPAPNLRSGFYESPGQMGSGCFGRVTSPFIGLWHSRAPVEFANSSGDRSFRETEPGAG